MTAFEYLKRLFWGPGSDFNAYQPFWGGFFNPILDSLFFLGAVELLRNSGISLYRWLLAAFLYLLLPCLLTKTLESFRMLSDLPVMVAVVAMGGSRLCLSFPARKTLLLVALLLIPSFALDFYHLTVPYHQVWSNPANWRACHKSYDRYQAYLVLKKEAEEKGPGFIFSDFIPGNNDPTLDLADEGFNLATKAGLPVDGVSWGAVVTNANYRPFLARRFPDGKAYFLSKGEDNSGGGRMLWVMPAVEKDVLLKWQKASLSLQPFIDNYLSFVHGKSYQPVLESFSLLILFSKGILSWSLPFGNWRLITT